VSPTETLLRGAKSIFAPRRTSYDYKIAAVTKFAPGILSNRRSYFVAPAWHLITARRWLLTFWPRGQSVPSDCRALYACRAVFGVDSSSRFPFRARTLAHTHTHAKSQTPLNTRTTHWLPLAWVTITGLLQVKVSGLPKVILEQAASQPGSELFGKIPASAAAGQSERRSAEYGKTPMSSPETALPGDGIRNGVHGCLGPDESRSKTASHSGGSTLGL